MVSNEVLEQLQSGYVLTPYLEKLAKWAQLYLSAGLPLHLRGPAGVGKTSLALFLAVGRGRPVHLIYGNEAFRGFDLVGSVIGERRKLKVDRFVHRVLKRTEESESLWADGPLIQAIRDGGTLVYDEFTRSRPEANNLLLSVLEEGMVEMPAPFRGPRLMNVHPEFRAIFTSNPAEYAGVHSTTDALHDRMITLDMGQRDYETDVAIVAGCSGLSNEDAAIVVSTVQRRQLKAGSRDAGSLRPAIMVARVVRQANIPVDRRNPDFRKVCDDIAGLPRRTEEEARE